MKTMQMMTFYSNEKRIKLDHNKMIFYKNTLKKEDHEKLARERRAKLRAQGKLKWKEKFETLFFIKN